MRPVDLKAFLEELARLSGEAILPFFRTRMGVSDKGREGQFDPVTEADRAAELVIRSKIRETFPSHGILGEEFESERLDAEFVWVIDPIDGTRAFLCGVPVWGTLIGLKRNGQPVLGVMHQPFTGELFLGDGGSAELKHLRGDRPFPVRKLQTRQTRTLSEAILMTTDPRLFPANEMTAYRLIEAQVKLARYGTDCYAYAMLAAGQIDLVIESGLKPYDIVGLIPIIEGAGGIVTTWQGKPATEGGQIIAAANATLHAAAIAALQPATSG